MLLIKNTLNLSEIKTLATTPDEPLFCMKRCLADKKVKKALGGLKGLKSQGYCAVGVLVLMLIFPLLDICTIHGFFNSSFSNLSHAQKDVFFRLKNNPLVNWRKIHYALVKSIIKASKENSDEAPLSRDPTCFIVDDSHLQKTGLLIEGVSRMFDHVTRRYLPGYKFLCLGYWTGEVYFPLDFSLHREKGKKKKKPFGLSIKKLKKQFRKFRPKGSSGLGRFKELDTDKISNTITILRRAAKNGFGAEYLLVDSWFVCEKLMLAVQAIQGVGHLLGLCKMGNAKYNYKDKYYTAKQLRHHLRKQEKRSRKLKMRYIEVKVEYKGIPLLLFLTRAHGSSKPRLLLSTNTRLSFTEAFRIYSIRWTIEVFFKEAKQLLGLGKCQSNYLDGQIADATLAMMRYTILAHEKQNRSYQTLGGLFKDLKDQTTELLLSQRIWGLVLKLLTQLGKWLDIDWQQVIPNLFHDEECYKKIQLILDALHKNPEPDTQPLLLNNAA